MKNITFDQPALKRLESGIDKLADVVKATLGPGGGNIILERHEGLVTTKDGVSVAVEINLPDELENIGAQIVKEAAAKTAINAGDGTTTATVLAQTIFKHGLKNLASGAKGIDLKRGIDKAVEFVVKELQQLSTPVKGLADYHQVATISTNGDEKLAQLITDAMEKVGPDGLILVESSGNADSKVKKVEGMKLERGFINHAFMTDHARQEAYYENPKILLTDQVLENLEFIKNPLFEQLNKEQRPIIIIAEDVQGSALTLMVLNRNKGWQVCAIQTPDFGETRKENLRDIAALTGATIISKSDGLSFDKMKMEHLGTCEKIRVTQWATFITNEHSGIALQNRLSQLEEQMKETNDNALVRLRERHAILKNGVAVIQVGGNSELEVREKKDRIDDALSATRAAAKEGIVPGGGVAYIRVLDVLERAKIEVSSEDEQTGIEIIKKSLPVPLWTIAQNVGQSGDVVIAEVKKGTGSYGFNAKTGEYTNLISQGIIDPTKVTRMALENAASVAGMLLTTKAIVSNVRPS